MPVNEASEILALSLIFVVHVAGGLMLVWGMLEGDARRGPWWRRRRDERPDGPPSDPPPPRPTVRAPLPLPGADPSPVRLRDETPLRDGYERPARRPQRTPDRTPSTEAAVAAGAQVLDAPADQPWGERQSVLTDVDGHVLCLVAAIRPTAPHA